MAFAFEVALVGERHIEQQFDGAAGERRRGLVTSFPFGIRVAGNAEQIGHLMLAQLLIWPQVGDEESHLEEIIGVERGWFALYPWGGVGGAGCHGSYRKAAKLGVGLPASLVDAETDVRASIAGMGSSQKTEYMVTPVFATPILTTSWLA